MNDLVDKIFSLCKPLKTNREYIDLIKSLEKNDVVIDNYFSNEIGVRFDVIFDNYDYRIYVDFVDLGKYLLEIRKNLSDIYKSYGLHWELYYLINNNRIITIEEREKLVKCNENKITCDELLLNWKKTLDILSDKLRLQDILSQIKENISSYKRVEVRNLIIVKNSLVSATDFALTSNNKVILLEDFDFVFCLTNYKGDLISFIGLLIDVNTTCGLMTFTLYRGNIFNDKITHLYDIQNIFCLYDYSFKQKYFENVINNYDETIQAQIDVFTDNVDTGDIKYQKEYMLQYFNKLENDGKEILRDGDEQELSYSRKDERRIS